MAGGRPRKFSSPEQLQEMIDAYFDDCDEKGKAYTITGLALALDCDRDTLINYETREGYEEFFSTVKKAKLRCEEYCAQALHGKGNPVGAIFNLKCNYGWQDKQVHEVSGNLQFEIKKPDDLT